MRLLFILIAFLFCNLSNIFPQNQIEKAETFFQNKYDNIENGKASTSNINQAIKLYKQSKTEPERTIGLLKSYEFKASWTDVQEDQKTKLYNKAIALAEKKIQEFPENGAIAYWHAANYARWADMIDITKAAQEGVLDEIKKLAEKAIELDDEYNQAGALRLLGGLHLEAPNIPLVLTWPSNNTAKRLLRKAYSLAPEHTANIYLYAKILYTINKEKKAKGILEELIKRTARNNYLLVDEKYIRLGQEFYNENY